jgi:hypothetical protein
VNNLSYVDENGIFIEDAFIMFHVLLHCTLVIETIFSVSYLPRTFLLPIFILFQFHGCDASVHIRFSSNGPSYGVSYFRHHSGSFYLPRVCFTLSNYRSDMKKSRRTSLRPSTATLIIIFLSTLVSTFDRCVLRAIVLAFVSSRSDAGAITGKNRENRGIPMAFR